MEDLENFWKFVYWENYWIYWAHFLKALNSSPSPLWLPAIAKRTRFTEALDSHRRSVKSKVYYCDAYLYFNTLLHVKKITQKKWLIIEIKWQVTMQGHRLDDLLLGKKHADIPFLNLSSSLAACSAVRSPDFNTTTVGFSSSVSSRSSSGISP